MPLKHTVKHLQEKYPTHHHHHYPLRHLYHHHYHHIQPHNHYHSSPPPPPPSQKHTCLHLSVPFSWVTRYCMGVRCFLSSSFSSCTAGGPSSLHDACSFFSFGDTSCCLLTACRIFITEILMDGKRFSEVSRLQTLLQKCKRQKWVILCSKWDLKKNRLRVVSLLDWQVVPIRITYVQFEFRLLSLNRILSKSWVSGCCFFSLKP